MEKKEPTQAEKIHQVLTYIKKGGSISGKAHCELIGIAKDCKVLPEDTGRQSIAEQLYGAFRRSDNAFGKKGSAMLSRFVSKYWYKDMLFDLEK